MLYLAGRPRALCPQPAHAAAVPGVGARAVRAVPVWSGLVGHRRHLLRRWRPPDRADSRGRVLAQEPRTRHPGRHPDEGNEGGDATARRGLPWVSRREVALVIVDWS